LVEPLGRPRPASRDVRAAAAGGVVAP